MRDRIPIKKDLIPYGFDIILGSDKFNLRFAYNKVADLFTCRLKRGNEILGIDALIYGVELFGDIYRSGSFPMLRIEPIDESDEAKEITWDNFTHTVFLTIDNGKD
jgi:hypothetical protein